MGVVGTVLTAVPVLAVAANFYQTVYRATLTALDADLTLFASPTSRWFSGCLPACNRLLARSPT